MSTLFRSLLVVILILPLGLKGQVSSKYTYTNSASATYSAVTGTTLCSGTGAGTSDSWYQGAAVNTAGSGIPIGFSFNFNCVTYTSLGIHTNGFIWFGSGTPATGTNSGQAPIANASSNLGGSGTIDGLICGWAGSVAGAMRAPAAAGSSIKYTTSGTAGSRIFKIEWAGYKITGGSGNATVPSTSIWLYETSNKIEVYVNSQSSILISGTRSGQFGLRGNSNADFKNTNGAGTMWSGIPAGTLNTQVTSTSAASYPNGGRVFTWTLTGSCCTPPTTQASAGAGTNITNTQCDINFTRGNGSAGVLVVARANATTQVTPASGSTYASPSTIFGSGTTTGSNNFVVYNGTANGASTATSPLTITNLTPGTTYAFDVYEYDGTCYKTPSHTFTVAIPLCLPPTLQASSTSVSAVSTTAATLSWTPGNGTSGELVILRQGAAVATDPTQNTSYTANANFGSGSAIGAGFVVSNTASGTVSLSNLITNTTYYYAIYTFNSSGPCYKTPALTGSFSTSNGAMTYAASTVIQSSVASVTQGAANQQIVQLQLNTNAGTSPALTLTTLKFNTNGSTLTSTLANDITAARIYYNTTNTLSGAIQFGSDITSFPGGATAITVNGSQVLQPSNNNYFFVLYDVSIGATVSNVLDAEITSLTYDDGTTPTTVAPSPTTAPTGTRAIASLGSFACTYTGSSQSITFTTIVGSGSTTTVASGAIDNVNYASQTIPFNFNFNDNIYTSFGISSNGYIWFGSGAPAVTTYNPIGNASANLGGTGTINGVIAAAGADLVNHGYISASPSTTQITTKVTGTAPNRVMIIEWTGFVAKSVASSYSCNFALSYMDESRLDFQILLYENNPGGANSNKIEMSYRNQSPFCVNDAYSFQVGLRGATNTDFATRSNTGNLTSSSSSLGAAATTAIALGTSYINGANVGIRYVKNISQPNISGALSNTCPVETSTLTALAANPVSPTYQWYLNGVAISGATTASYDAAASGNYIVAASNAGCGKVSAVSAVTITPCVSNTITTSDVAAQVCAGSALSINYTATGTFVSGNVFTAQLSDASGSFASPTTIGTITSTTSGIITANPGSIPTLTAAGIAYQIRVISSNPAITGSTTSAFEVLDPAPIISITNPASGCTPATVDITASGIVTVTNGTTVSSVSYWDNLAANSAYSGNPSAVSVASTVYVKYSNGCGSDVKPIVVSFANPSIASHTKINPSTCAASNGSITLNGLQPSTTYSVVYQKNGPPNVGPTNYTTNGTGALTISSLGDGAYDSFVVSLAGCASTPVYPSSGFIALNDPTPPVVSSISSTNPSTCSGANGSIQLNGLLPSTSYSVSYDRNTLTTSAGSISTDAFGILIINSLSEGNYDNIVVGLSGCNSSPVPSTGVIALVPPSSPAISSTSINNPSTCSGNDGSILINGLSASTSYTISYLKNGNPFSSGSLLSNGLGTLTLNGLTSGSYSNLVATNASGCYSAAYPSSGSLTLTDPPTPSIAGYSANDPSSCSGNNGSILLSGLTPSSAYLVSYRKNAGATINAGSISSNVAGIVNVSGLSNGDYDQIIITQNGCSSDPYPISGSITLYDPAIPSTTPGAIPAEVCGSNSLVLEATDALAGEDYKWYSTASGASLLQTGGNTFGTPLLSSSQTYYVSIFNTSTGCETPGRIPVTATIFAKPVSVISGTLLGCASTGVVLGSTGSAAGSGSISSYQWKLNTTDIPLATLSAYTATSAGNYTLLIGNSNGCFTTSSVSAVSLNPAPTASGTGMLATCENGPLVVSGLSSSNGTIAWSVITGNGGISNASIINPTYTPDILDVGSTVTLRLTVSNSPCPAAIYDQQITIAPRPILSPSTVNINAANSSQLLSITNVDANSNYVWTPATDLYTDASLTLPYSAGSSATTVYTAPFTSLIYSVTAASTITGCTTGASTVVVNVDPAITNQICDANLPSGLVTVTAVPVFTVMSLSGATASPGAACSPIDKDVWFRAVVPYNGEIHVITQQHNDPIASKNINSALIQLFTAATCSTGVTSVGCDAGGAAGQMAYAKASGLTPGATVYIRLARTTSGNAAPSQYIRMAVTNGLTWTGAQNSDMSNPANWMGGDATSLTIPSVNTTVIIPANSSNVYPLVNGIQSVHGIEFVNAPNTNWIPTVQIMAGSELRLQASATYKSFITRSGLFINQAIPKITGQGTLRFNEGGLNSAEILYLTRFSGVVAVRSGVNVVSNGRLRMENNSVLLCGGVAPGDLTKNYGGTVSGNILYERSGSLYGGFNYWSSPVSGSNTSVLFSNYGNNIYQYDNTIAGGSIQGAWGNPITSSIPMIPGRGYIQTFAGNGTVNFNGPANQNPISFPVTVNGSNNFNLIGNPYPASLSYAQLHAANSNLGAVYLWHSSGTSPYNVSSYVVMSGLGVVAGNPVAGFTAAEISAGQGFLAQAAATGTIQFHPNQLVPNYPGNSVQFLESSPYSILKLRLKNADLAAFDIAIGFGENGTEGDDFGYDAPRMPSSETLELYSFIGDAQYTTQLLPTLNGPRVIDLGTVNSGTDTYSFELNQFEQFEEGVNVYLEDRKTQAFILLNQQSTYTYQNDPTFDGIRFRLHFLAPNRLLTTATCETENNGSILLSNINTGYPLMAELKNEQGMSLAQQDSISGAFSFDHLAAGVYQLLTSYDGNSFTSNWVNVDGIGQLANSSIQSSAIEASLDNANISFEANISATTGTLWDFGDGSPLLAGTAITHTYLAAGIYTVQLHLTNEGCTRTVTKEIRITENVTGISTASLPNVSIKAYPNPTNDELLLELDAMQSVRFELNDITGKHILSRQLQGKLNSINTSQLEAGVYVAKISTENNSVCFRIIVAH